MAYDNQGAAVGAAGHYASAIVAALITSGSIVDAEGAVEVFGSILPDVFAACEELKGTLPEQEAPARAPRGGGRSYPRKSAGNGGGQSQDPGSIDFRGGKHAGKTIAAVYEEAPDYLEWCVSNLNNDFMVGKIEAYLATVS